MEKQKDWKSLLKADPTEQLLQEVGNLDKYYFLREIMEKPEDDIEASKLRNTLVDEIIEKQMEDGSWNGQPYDYANGTTHQLMKLMELYRRMGEYGGEQLIGKDVMKEYTRVQFPDNDNRRALGFDKPLLDNSELPQEQTYPTGGASPESFGHSGYTGTFVWIDPVYEISYVFLSNRVYPTRYNNLLSDLNIRTEILQAIYDSILE